MEIAKKESGMISIRIDADLKDKLQHESEQKRITLSSLLDQIISEHIHWNKLSSDIGFLPLPRRILSSFVNSLDETDVSQIGETIGKDEFRNIIKYFYGDVDLDSTLRLMERWFKSAKMNCRHIIDDNKNEYIVQHELGSKWSAFCISTMDSLLQEIGQKLIEKNSDEHCFSFKIGSLEATG